MAKRKKKVRAKSARSSGSKAAPKRPQRPKPPVWKKQSRFSSLTTGAEKFSLTDLPFSYDETRLVLMVRDPYWAFSYWDFSAETWSDIKAKLKADPSLKPTMRIHDLSASRSFDLLVSLETKNWYLHLGIPDHRYVAELGLGGGRSRFHPIVRSNEVETPRDSPSERVDPEWNARDFEELYRLSGGGFPGLGSPGSHSAPPAL